MTTLSIVLPDALAKASQEVAKELGVSRTKFIRQAIVHELENFQSRLELKAMARSFTAMKSCKSYLKEMEEITETLHSDLPKDESQWWNKERS
jgi:metal-responsive CopG/Arc/MetJ family transcriptional regulator